MRATPAVARHAFVFLAVGVAIACGTSPTQPSKIWSIAIGGVTSVSHPGETSQLTATANSSTSGVKKDVTTVASWIWEGSPGVATVRAGLLTGIKYGRGQVRVTHEGLTASVTVSVLPAGAFLLTGYVTEAGRPVIGVNVEVTSASGTLSARTDNRGAYALPGAGPVTLRVAMAGHEPDVRSLTVQNDQQVDLELREIIVPPPPSPPLPPAPPYLGILGAYTLTFTASPSCVLPQEVMQRTYAARIDEANFWLVDDELEVMVTGADIVTTGRYAAGFTGNLGEGTVTFLLKDGRALPTPPYAFAQIIGTMELHLVGSATGIVTEQRIETRFGGTAYVRTPSTGALLASCAANDHKLVFVR